MLKPRIKIQLTILFSLIIVIVVLAFRINDANETKVDRLNELRYENTNYHQSAPEYYEEEEKEETIIKEIIKPVEEPFPPSEPAEEPNDEDSDLNEEDIDVENILEEITLEEDLAEGILEEINDKSEEEIKEKSFFTFDSNGDVMVFDGFEEKENNIIQAGNTIATYDKSYATLRIKEGLFKMSPNTELTIIEDSDEENIEIDLIKGNLIIIKMDAFVKITTENSTITSSGQNLPFYRVTVGDNMETIVAVLKDPLLDRNWVRVEIFDENENPLGALFLYEKEKLTILEKLVKEIQSGEVINIKEVVESF